MEQVCKVCSVTIDGDVVKFSYGKPGTRERLYARVCQYAKCAGCINQSECSKPLSLKDCYDSYFEPQKELEVKSDAAINL